MGPNYKRMLEGKLYDPGDMEILTEQNGYQLAMAAYNATGPMDYEERERLMKEMLGDVGENTYLQAPVYANWGGKHVHIGRNVYANFNLTMVDDGHIYIGDYVMIGPNVTIATAGHPIEPGLRRAGLQYNMDVHIGSNTWIGAGVVIMPGVTIGENTVIGGGSVVTKDIPANVVAVGNPCRVLRPVGEQDRKYYYKDREIDLEIPDQD